jgi:hypothetical protein
VTGKVLDASVILAAILAEPGGDAVFDMLETAVVSTVSRRFRSEAGEDSGSTGCGYPQSWIVARRSIVSRTCQDA